MSTARNGDTTGEVTSQSAKPRMVLDRLPLRTGQTPAAQRAHKRKVSVMRWLFPSAAVMLVSIVVAWSQWQTIETGFKVGFSRINPEDAKSLRMVKPRFSGLNEQARPFMLTADEARRASPSADSILLTNPKGDITTSGGAWLALTAAHGNYAQKNRILDLGGGVDLFHDDGIHFTTDTARIDLKAGTAEGNDPVTGSGPSIEVISQGFRLLNDGRTVIFTGKATALLYPSDKRKLKEPPKRLEK